MVRLLVIPSKFPRTLKIEHAVAALPEIPLFIHLNLDKGRLKGAGLIEKGFQPSLRGYPAKDRHGEQ